MSLLSFACTYSDTLSAVWMDMRTTGIVDDILKRVRNQNKNYLKPLCGLPISPYFSALKIKWLLENEPKVQKAIEEKRCMFGTIDSWLIWVGISRDDNDKKMLIHLLSCFSMSI